MRRDFTITAFILGLSVIFLLFLLMGCKQAPVENEPGTLFNESLNNEIESLVNVSNVSLGIEEFYFNYSPRIDSKYEIARDDVFSLSRENLTSTEISFLGVMLGDSYDEVVQRLGIPNREFTPYDDSYKNLDYAMKIGINSTAPAITFHLENDSVTRISILPYFAKYLNGNTSIATPKATIYALLDTPDYQSFLSSFKVFHYVEKGVDVYLKGEYVNRVSFYFPREFKGVEYLTTEQEVAQGVMANVTEPVEIQ
jgi:hypothetical protein